MRCTLCVFNTCPSINNLNNVKGCFHHKLFLLFCITTTVCIEDDYHGDSGNLFDELPVVFYKNIKS